MWLLFQTIGCLRGRSLATTLLTIGCRNGRHITAMLFQIIAHELAVCAQLFGLWSGDMRTARKLTLRSQRDFAFLWGIIHRRARHEMQT